MSHVSESPSPSSKASVRLGVYFRTVLGFAQGRPLGSFPFFVNLFIPTSPTFATLASMCCKLPKSLSSDGMRFQGRHTPPSLLATRESRPAGNASGKAPPPACFPAPAFVVCFAQRARTPRWRVFPSPFHVRKFFPDRLDPDQSASISSLVDLWESGGEHFQKFSALPL